MGYKQKGGWFSVVNGVPVTKHPLTSGFGHGWKYGNPKGVLLHATAGCGSDIHGVLAGRGISAHFNVDQTGKIYQYVSLLDTAYHAYDASYVYYGMETSALAGTCNHNDKQMASIVALSAGLVEFTKRRWDVAIPLKHPPGSALVAGFREHKDGTADGWNPNVHVDGVITYAPAPGWTWKKFFDAVAGGVGDVIYIVKGKKYAKAANAARRLRGLLKKAEPGQELHVKVRQK